MVVCYGVVVVVEVDSVLAVAVVVVLEAFARVVPEVVQAEVVH